MKRCILITGSSRGIGKAIALKLSRLGYSIVLHYHHNLEAAQQVQQQIEANQGTARILQFDIANRQQTQQVLIDDIAENNIYYGVICNAGIAKDSAFPALTEEDWDQVIHTNLDGFYNVLKPLVMPMIRAKKGGRIITLASISGLIGNRGQVNYSAAKAGIIGATKSLALELAKRKITVNCIAPGVIETEMTAGLPLEEVIKAIPARRIGQAEEVAGLAAYLMSDEAAYITRQVISINGGLC